MSLTPAIPTLPASTPKELVPLLSALKANIEYVTGANKSTTKSATATDVAAIVATTAADDTTPLAPTGLTAASGFGFVALSWDEPAASPAIDRTVIYRATDNNEQLAVEIDSTKAAQYKAIVEDTNTYYFWVLFVSSDGVVGPLTTQSVNGASTKNILTVTNGLIQPDTTFNVDISGKEILVTGAAGQAADDYTVIYDGKMSSFKWNGASHDLDKPLTRIESGVEASGTTITIPGTFTDQPKIVVSPVSLMSFDVTYVAQNQFQRFAAENIDLVAGQWQFDIVGELRLSAYGGVTSVNWANGSTASETVTSGVYTTPANTTDWTVFVELLSMRGTGTAPNYYLRDATWTVYYRVALSGSGWTVGSTQTNDLGPTIKPVIASQAVSLTAGTWEFYIEVVYADTTGTFPVGTGGYQPNSATPSNDLGFTHYAHTQTGQVVLDSGVMHWQAIG